ncbi:unnamed protein product [Orchesella dallaii]|uniref:BTB domain-containing protein n=1 Tax=Orchesella dallaii TaxID=48710 RepID=A0ABP1RPQ8_9HEXA
MKLTLLDTNQLFIWKEVAGLQQYDFTYVLAQCPLELGVVPLKSNEGTESLRNFMSEIRNKLVVSPLRAPVGSELSKNSDIPRYWMIIKLYDVAKLFASKPEVKVSLKVEVELEDPLNLPPVPDHRVFNKDILLNQIQCDFKIIAKDDQVLQCHKALLAARSKVFTTMFKAACEETTNNQVKLPISHAGADAFLKFLYYSDVEAALESPTLVMDLLDLGHKYDISPLESKMKKILSGRNNWWYSADNALRLFDWSCKVTEHGDLKKKAVDVIRSKVQELKGLNRFQQMFPNSIGAELFIASLQSFPIL